MAPKSHLRLGVISFIALAATWLGRDAAQNLPPIMNKRHLLQAGNSSRANGNRAIRRSFAGDGLGPVFNGRSCAECHNQGGIGGAGPAKVNALLVSAFVISFVDRRDFQFITGVPPEEAADPKNPLKQPDRAKLAEIHPLLRKTNSFPLHRFGTGKEFTAWQTKLLAEFGQCVASDKKTDEQKARTACELLASSPDLSLRTTQLVDGVKVALILSQRNAPSLFGAALLDRIPDRVLEEVAAEQERDALASKPWPIDSRTSPPVSGRVARLKDGRIGRFGWKGNVATLREFTLQACSDEIGLEVPGFPRSVPPWLKAYKAPGLDMSAEQCDRLAGFVASLAKPASHHAESQHQANDLAAGQKLFRSIGCAACHRPKLGDVPGIYSDLLLHDMGQSLSDAGNYGTNPKFVPSKDNPNPLPVSDLEKESAEKEKPPQFAAGALEWRTPPLWGLRDSAPYMHDGRAQNLFEAVSMHGGEGRTSAEAFEKLPMDERVQIDLFLKSLPLGNEDSFEWKASPRQHGLTLLWWTTGGLGACMCLAVVGWRLRRRKLHASGEA